MFLFLVSFILYVLIENVHKTVGLEQFRITTVTALIYREYQPKGKVFKNHAVWAGAHGSSKLKRFSAVGILQNNNKRCQKSCTVKQPLPIQEELAVNFVRQSFCLFQVEKIKRPAHSHRCVQLQWLIRHLLRWKLGGAVNLVNKAKRSNQALKVKTPVWVAYGCLWP